MVRILRLVTRPWLFVLTIVALFGVAGNHLAGTLGVPPLHVTLPITEAGHPMPHLELQRLAGGAGELPIPVGRVTLVSFFATWCLDCRQELPELEHVAAEYATQGLSLQFVDLAETPSVVAKFASDLNLSTRPWLDETGLGAKHLNVSVVPTTVMVDSKGDVRAHWAGELPEALLRQRIVSLLAAEQRSVTR